MRNRWVILKHILSISKESLESFHYDLLLEDRDFCRTWRLGSFPLMDGPIVAAIPLPPHKLYWLDREESVVSGGRGWAKRVAKGEFSGSLPLNPNECFSVKINRGIDHYSTYPPF